MIEIDEEDGDGARIVVNDASDRVDDSCVVV